MRNLFASPQGITVLRLVFGLLQGLALYALTRSLEAKAWPSTDLRIYDPLLDVARYVPIFAIVSIGNLRSKTAAIWIALMAALCAGLGFYQGFRDPTPVNTYLIWPSWFDFHFGLFVLLFVSHSLVAAADADRRKIASFPTYFDLTWRLATQLLLSSIFVLLLWGILFLGASLFRAIGIEFFFTTIQKSWFVFPVTAVASSAALHLTDAHTGLVRGARALLLNLLSWLMPLMTVIAVGFVCTLPFTGLEPLWRTKFATGSLLGAVTILVLLVNSHFQDGVPRPENASRFLRVLRLPAVLVLTPLTALAAYGLFLRVQQYGWTSSRVIVLVLLILAACYALGYAIAALTSGTALRRLPVTNVVTAIVGIVCILALLTPIADPARIAVASQVKRLEDGAVDPSKFDFRFLRFGSARFGRDALERLQARKEGPNATRISEQATQALRAVSPYTFSANQPPPSRATTETRRANIAMIRTGASALPSDFLQEDWSSHAGVNGLPSCLTRAAGKCDAVVIDLGMDGSPAIVLSNDRNPAVISAAWVFAQDPAGKWTLEGTLANYYCPGVKAGVSAGEIDLAPARFKDIQVNGIRLSLNKPCPPGTR